MVFPWVSLTAAVWLGSSHPVENLRGLPIFGIRRTAQDHFAVFLRAAKLLEKTTGKCNLMGFNGDLIVI
jgi:hypothetical protein